MASPTAFWDRIAEDYAKKPVPDEEVYQKKLAATREYFRPDMDVLELGCGTGSTAIAHAPHVGSYTAIDISPKMIEIAERKLAEVPVDNLKFCVSTLEDLQIADGSFNAVLGLSILHLLADRDAAIRRAYRWLKPSGIFVTSTACLGDKMAYFRFIAPIGKFLGLMPLVKTFTRQELEDSLKAAGFAIDYQFFTKGNGGTWFAIAMKPN